MVDVSLLKTLGTIKQYDADDFIVYEGAQGDEMYIILSGKVSVHINSQGDYPVKIAEMGPGEIFGEMSVLEGLPRSATVIALSKVVLLSVNKDNFLLFIEKQPKMAYKIMSTLCARIRTTNAAAKEFQNQYKALTSSNTVFKADKEKAKTEKVVKTEINGALFPEGHKAFDAKLEGDHEKYLYKVNVKCPLCDKEFKANSQKISKLRVLSCDRDMRRHFEDDFEPLWYNIWVCPECYYASYYHDFNGIPRKTIKDIKSKMSNIKKSVKLKLDEIQTIDQVFAEYYLAIACAEAGNGDALKKAKLWMHVSWLYKDFNDEEMYKKTAQYALKYYLDTYYNSTNDFRPEDEQQFCLIISELYVLEGKMDEAFKYLRIAKMQRNGSKVYSQMAEQRIDEMKDVVKDDEDILQPEA